MVIEILPEAESDIRTAYVWYFDISEVLANRFEAEVEKHLIAISKNYLHYENRYLSVRVCVLKKFPYSIHFTVENQVILILLVTHHKKNPAKWFKRLKAIQKRQNL